MTDHFQPDARIDLHARSPEAALAQLAYAVESGRYTGRALEVVHGQGSGALREKVRAWGRQSRHVKRVWEGENYFLPGGSGVTIFFL